MTAKEQPIARSRSYAIPLRPNKMFNNNSIACLSRLCHDLRRMTDNTNNTNNTNNTTINSGSGRNVTRRTFIKRTAGAAVVFGAIGSLAYGSSSGSIMSTYTNAQGQSATATCSYYIPGSGGFDCISCPGLTPAETQSFCDGVNSGNTDLNKKNGGHKPTDYKPC